MKKIVFLSMGLFAIAALSLQSHACVATDTGPTASVEKSYKSTAGTTYDITQRVAPEVANISALGQASGQETVVHRSDHMVDNVNFFWNPAAPSMTVNNAMHLLAVDEPERSYVIMNGYNLELSKSKKTANGLPLVGAAQHSHQMVWVMKRPAWKMYYKRC